MKVRRIPHHCAPSTEAGFSLIEVVIALAVIAIAMGALIDSSSSATRHTLHLRDKTLAHWVGMNELSKLQISKDWLGIGKQSGTVEMADRNWAWERTVSATDVPDLRRVDIRVRFKEDPKGTSIDLISGFLGKPQGKP